MRVIQLEHPAILDDLLSHKYVCCICQDSFFTFLTKIVNFLTILVKIVRKLSPTYFVVYKCVAEQHARSTFPCDQTLALSSEILGYIMGNK